MTRGDVVTVASGSGYGSKPRPAVVVQSDDFMELASVILCLITSDPIDAPSFRLPLKPNATDGLRSDSWIMIDKVVTVDRTKVGKRIGRLSAEQMLDINRNVAVMLGLAG